MKSVSFTIAEMILEISSKLHLRNVDLVGPLNNFQINEMSANSLPKLSIKYEQFFSRYKPTGLPVYRVGTRFQIFRADREFWEVIVWTGQTEIYLRTNSKWDEIVLIEQNTIENIDLNILNYGIGELIIRSAIIENCGIVFHSSGLDDNGKGILFVGRSGSGKSTQMGFWCQFSGIIPLNDDRNAVRNDLNQSTCFSMPWGGADKIVSNHSARLSALILLEQAPENSIRQLSGTEAAPLLLARAFLPYWDAELMQRAISNLDHIIKNVPVFRLRCKRSPEVVSLVRSVL